MAVPRLCCLLALLLLVAPACTVLGDQEPDLDEIEALNPIDIDLGAIRPTSCGFDERVDIAVTNRSMGDITTWGLFFDLYWQKKGDEIFTPGPVSTSPVVLAPGESTTMSMYWGMDMGALLADATSVRVLASNMDPSDPELPAVTVAATDHCDAAGADGLRIMPVTLDPTGLTNVRQPLADITPAVCPLAEVSGALVENRSAAAISAWAAWTVDPDTLDEYSRQEYGDEVTVFAAPVEIAPGEQFQFQAAMPPGVDVTEIAVMTNQPVHPFDDLAISWLDTCADPSGQ